MDDRPHLKYLSALPTRFLILAKTFLFFLALLTVFRVILYFVFFDTFSNIPFGLTLKSFWLGFRFDIRLIVLIWLPFILLSWIPFLKLEKPKSGLVGWQIYWLIMALALLAFYIADLGNFGYLGNRLDASILGLASDFWISINMLWETYPVIIIAILLVGCMWLMYYLLTSKVLNPLAPPGKRWPIWQRSILYVLTFIITFGMGYGKWSRYPLRWSDAFFSQNENANQLAINPVLFFFNTYSRRNVGWNNEKVKLYHSEFADYFDFPRGDSLKFSRHTYLPDTTYNDPNIVIFILETFPTYKSGAYGNPMNASPVLDSIASESIHFRNFYVPKFSTAASIFCAMAGLPDVSTVNKSSTRDPYAIQQHFIMNDLEGYKKHFFIGGSANWGDIGGFFKRNVEGIVIHEEGGYEAPEINAWGISDYELFQDIHRTINEEQEPFITVALTAGHHPPFSIPDETPFKRDIYEGDFYDTGFSDQKEYDSFRFMDYSIGEFFKKAKQSDYFDNTVFVILGDHGFGHPSMPAHYGRLSLHYYQVPLVIYAPGLGVEPRDVYRPASEIDLMPTLMGLLGKSFTNTALGKDLINLPDSIPHYAFTFTAGTGSYGLISEDYVLTKRDGDSSKVYDISNAELLSERNSEMSFMDSLSDAYYELSKYLRYHNE